MTRKEKIGIIVLTLIVGFAVIGGVYRALNPEPILTWSQHDSELDKLNKTLKKLAEEIQSTIGPGACSSDDECKLAGLGAQTCDGYKDFVVYSTKDTDESSLLRLVSQFNVAAKKLNSLSLVAAKCGIEPAPVKCIQKHCVPVTP